MPQERTEAEEKQHIEQERAKNAKGGFWHNGAVWLLGRFPLTKHRYQNWTRGRRILVGWLLWLLCLPIIPLVAIALWYFSDPEGFKRSPWAKGLIGLLVVWVGAFGFIATGQFQPDQDGRYSPVQTQQQRSGNTTNGGDGQADQNAKDAKDAQDKKAGQSGQAQPSGTGHDSNKQPKARADGETEVVNRDPAAVASPASKEKVKRQSESRPSQGRSFANCTEAFEAGVFDIRRSDPAYQPKLDRDNDGIACER